MAHAKDPQADGVSPPREEKPREEKLQEDKLSEEKLSEEKSGEDKPPVADTLGDDLNSSLDEVLDLLALEVERLKESLEFYRLSEHPDREQLIRWVVQQIDLRQDRLEDIKALILARDDNQLH